MNVKAFRARHGLTGADTARLLGVSARAVRAWEQEQGPMARRMPAPARRLMWLIDRHGTDLLADYPPD
jgi:DNA-binding transcriptional regulator YiaG